MAVALQLLRCSRQRIKKSPWAILCNMNCLCNKNIVTKNYSFSLKHNCLNFEVISEILFSDGSSLLIDNAKSFQALLKNNSSMIVIFSDLKSLVYFLKKSRFSVSKMIFVGVFMFDCRQVNVFLDIESTITTTNL